MNVNIDFSLLYVLFCIVLILIVAKKTLFAKLDKILNERHEMIEGAREAAAGDEENIENALAEVNEKLNQARAEAFSTRQTMRNKTLEEQKNIVEEARESAAGKITAAQEELDQALTDARSQLEGEAQVIAEEITNRLLGRTA